MLHPYSHLAKRPGVLARPFPGERRTRIQNGRWLHLAASRLPKELLHVHTSEAPHHADTGRNLNRDPWSVCHSEGLHVLVRSFLPLTLNQGARPMLCYRCNSTMCQESSIYHQSTDYTPDLNDAKAMRSYSWHCLICGNFEDPIILANRLKSAPVITAVAA